MVGVERFELPTSCSQSKRATGLRYTPKLELYQYIPRLIRARLWGVLFMVFDFDRFHFDGRDGSGS